MNKWFYLVFLILIIGLIGCEKKQYNDSIIGRWRWIKSTAGPNGGAVNAELYDTTYFIEFSNNGNYSMYNNSEELIFTSRYELTLNPQYKSFILLDEQPDYIRNYRIWADTLSIACPKCPGIIAWITFYIRTK